MEMQHFTHEHTLTSSMVSDKETDYICFICSNQISGLVYTCEDCIYQRHESCSAIPKVIEKHSFHSAHSLFLYFPDLMKEVEDIYFICDGCGQLSSLYRFVCKSCTVSLDIKCASLTNQEIQARAGRGHVKTTILHFSHTHPLTRCIVRTLFEAKCLACKEVISGPAYVCLNCRFSLHETCLNDMPQEIEHPFHAHRLLPNPLNGNTLTCSACFEDIRGISFGCFDCSFYLHLSCGKYQTRAIKHELHEHDLLYFGARNIGRCRKCHYCGKSCSSSFFCCVRCQFDIHLECLPLPLTLKHNRHFHQLTLKDSVIEDDFGQYYCYICETERNPAHDVYYCDECNYTAHIDCVISKVEPPIEIYSYLVPRHTGVESEPDIVADQKLAHDKPDDENAEALRELDEIEKEILKINEQLDALFNKSVALRNKQLNVETRFSTEKRLSYYYSRRNTEVSLNSQATKGN